MTFDEEELLAEYAPEEKKLSKFRSQRTSLLDRNMTNQSAAITGLKNRIQQKGSDPAEKRFGASPAGKVLSSFRSPVNQQFHRHSVRNSHLQKQHSATNEGQHAPSNALENSQYMNLPLYTPLVYDGHTLGAPEAQD